MKNAEEVMEQFMNNWQNMKKYQNISLNEMMPNYETIESAFSLERKIVATYDQRNELEDKRKKKKK